MSCRWDGLNMADNVLSRTSSDQRTKATDTSIYSLRLSRQPYTDTLKPQYPMHFSADISRKKPHIIINSSTKTKLKKPKMHRMGVPPFSVNRPKPKCHFHTILNLFVFFKVTALFKDCRITTERPCDILKLNLLIWLCVRKIMLLSLITLETIVKLQLIKPKMYVCI